MSHSSGIPVSENLKNVFGAALTDTTRYIKAQIENEEVVPINTSQKSGSWEEDLAGVSLQLEPEKAAYILFRFDNDTPTWALFCYVPDKAKVKEKMLYASTRSNLKQQLGMSYFSDEVFGTVPNDFSVQGYKHHVTSKKTEAPLTEREQYKKAELESGEIYTGGASTYVHGVAFPVEKGAIDAVKALISGSVNYVQVAIDCDGEKIIADHTGITDFEGLKNEIPTHEPRFHFFAYTHEFEGNNQTSYIFLYSCPDGSKGTKSAPVKMRMLYSSSKANVGEIVAQLGGKIDARLEVNSPEDLIEEEILSQLHPQAEKKEAAFSKPSRPGRGPRNLIRNRN
jgi:twinfilin-like protein